MDEAQEKIDKLYTDIWFLLKDEPPEVKDQIMRMLGYRKPLDRPELRREIEAILRAHIIAYERAWSDKSTFGSEQANKTTDQILALIIPKDKPPLLSDEKLQDLIADSDSLSLSSDCSLQEAVENSRKAIAQAQRDSDIEWYEA